MTTVYRATRTTATLAAWQQRWLDAKRVAAGHWVDILGCLSPSLADALARTGRHVPCPSPTHPGKSVDGFRVFQNVAETGGGICNTCGTFHDGFALLGWINGWTPRESLEAVEQALGISAGIATAPIRVPPAPPRRSTAKDGREMERRRSNLNRTWAATVPIEDPEAEPARLYLARRGLGWLGATEWRFHPSLPYYDGRDCLGSYPALVALVQTAAGVPVTLHRTYLAPDGSKADVPAPKKLMAYLEECPLIGAATWLSKPGPCIAVAEGIETSLAVQEALRCPTAAALNAAMLAGFIPPPGVKRVFVMADKDRPSKPHPRGHGQEAAIELTRRLWAMGVQASAMIPRRAIPDGEKSIDWLDIWNTYPADFPRPCDLRNVA